MKSTTLPAAFVLLMCVFAADARGVSKVVPAAPVRATATDAALAPIIAVADRFTAAIKAMDLESAGAMLDPQVLILESGGAERSRDEYMGHHAVADAAFLSSANVKVLRRTGGVQGDLAWLGTESEITPAKAGEKVVLSTETMVLRRAAQGWKIVHIHWSSRTKKNS